MPVIMTDLMLIASLVVVHKCTLTGPARVLEHLLSTMIALHVRAHTTILPSGLLST